MQIYPIERFMNNVVITDTCWLWTAYKNKLGYGCFTNCGKKWLAHRFAYETLIGNIPTSKLVLHHCDNPGCVNPDHLFIGTDMDNVRDMISKNRARHPHGENHPRAKLTESEVLTINKMFGSYTGLEIAKRFNVDPATISHIKVGRHWKYIKEMGNAR